MRASHSMIDTTFDFRSDTLPGGDPDELSPTLRRYHALLWSKPLPNGTRFELVSTTPGAYLHHRSDVGEFYLASDTMMQTFTRRIALQHIMAEFPKAEHEAFMAAAYTIGGMVVFPGNRIGRRMTINGARGFHPRIADRMDLTLECIRRHYLGQDSPLANVLDRYSDFFCLFGDFRGYVDFFLLQDLVTTDAAAVSFFMPFDDFGSPLPSDVETYREFRRVSCEFIASRNRRVEASARTLDIDRAMSGP